MADRFPGYDVLAKRDTPSWNDQTRAVVDQRLALPEAGDVLTAQQVATLRALADRVVPQPRHRPPVNTVAILLDKLASDAGDGYRHHLLPPLREAWRQGLDALGREAQARHHAPFASLDAGELDALLGDVEDGKVGVECWGDLPPRVFWNWRMLPDLVTAYYAHPSAWSAMGFGGPASPRGYVRLAADRRDPWEAVEADDGSLLSADTRNRLVR